MSAALDLELRYLIMLFQRRECAKSAERGVSEVWEEGRARDIKSSELGVSEVAWTKEHGEKSS